MPGMYELPLRTGPAGIVVAVQGDAEAVANWRRWLGVETLPLAPGMPTVGTAEEAAALALADVLLQIEIARALPVRGGVVSQQPWLSDLVAHAAAVLERAISCPIGPADGSARIFWWTTRRSMKSSRRSAGPVERKWSRSARTKAGRLSSAHSRRRDSSRPSTPRTRHRS